MKSRRRRADEAEASPPAATGPRICGYCGEQERAAREPPRRRTFRDPEIDPGILAPSSNRERYNEFSKDESLLNILDGSCSNRTSFKSLAIIRRPQQYPKNDSPPSCLKRAGNKSKTRSSRGRRVIFDDAPSSATLDERATFTSTDDDYYYLSSSSSSSGGGGSGSGRSPGRAPLVGPGVPSTPGRSRIAGLARESRRRRGVRSREPSSRGSRDGHGEMRRALARSGRPRLPEDLALGVGATEEREEEEEELVSDKATQCPERTREWADVASIGAACCSSPSPSTSSRRRGLDEPEARAGGPASALADYEHRLLADLSRLSLTSSACCTDGGREEPRTPRPPAVRVVKQRDARSRAALKRMFIYPPGGRAGRRAAGRPLTLYKKWSNIDSHVRGDPRSGFKYTVYYLQKFESDKWLPGDNSGRPFCELEDARCSKDYG